MFFNTESRLTTLNIDCDAIIKIIDNLNPAKAHGWDGISIKMMKMCEQSITIPLIMIFKNALLSGTYPDIWKKRKYCTYSQKRK